MVRALGNYQTNDSKFLLAQSTPLRSFNLRSPHLPLTREHAARFQQFWRRINAALLSINSVAA